MSETHTHLMKQGRAVLKHEFEISLVDGDGKRHLGMTGPNTRLSINSTTEFLDERRAGRMQHVRQSIDSEECTMEGQFREFMAHEFLTLLAAEGATPTIEQHLTLVPEKIAGPLFNGDSKFQPNTPMGWPQAHNSTVFPAPGTPNWGSPSGSGTTYYIWVVPIFADLDVEHGHTAASYTNLTTFAAYTRGVDYVYGTPSASATGMHTLPTAIVLTWTTASDPAPTHYAVVIGTTNVITAATSYVSAVVLASALAASITAIGSQQFGATPAVADMVNVAVEGVGSGTRTHTSKTETTDYTVDRANGEITLAGAGIDPDESVRVTYWRLVKGYKEDNVGGSVTGEIYKHFRLECYVSDDPDPDDARARGVRIDVWRVNIAGLRKDLIASGPSFHEYLNFTFNPELDSAQGCFFTIRTEGDCSSLIDVFSETVAPSNS